MAKIQLNGKKISIHTNFSVRDLIKKYKLQEKKIAIELNGMILPKENYGKKKLKNNEQLKLYSLCGG